MASNKIPYHEVIGLIPAAGKATRLSPLTGSKEILPIGLQTPEGTPKVACHYLFEHMTKAGIKKAYVIIREDKWDIPACFGDGTAYGIHLAYLMMGRPYGPPFTLDQACPFIQDALVALGFPDIIFRSDDAFKRLIAKQVETKADVVLGLFPTQQPQKVDMVEIDHHYRVKRIQIKPDKTGLKHTWGIAVWTPVFTHFMHDYLMTVQSSFETAENEKTELHVGDVIQAGIADGLKIWSVPVSNEPYIDIGTPENLERIRNQIKGKR